MVPPAWNISHWVSDTTILVNQKIQFKAAFFIFSRISQIIIFLMKTPIKKDFYLGFGLHSFLSNCHICLKNVGVAMHDVKLVWNTFWNFLSVDLTFLIACSKKTESPSLLTSLSVWPSGPAGTRSIRCWSWFHCFLILTMNNYINLVTVVYTSCGTFAAILKKTFQSYTSIFKCILFTMIHLS